MNIVEVKNLTKYFPVEKGILFRSVVGHVKAVDGVSFSIPEGETLGLVGESGSGKSTVGNMILRLLPPTSGEILYRGETILNRSRAEAREFHSRAQMVFQNPFASLNPRMIVGDIIGRVLRVQKPSLKGSEVRDRVLQSLEEVGLKKEHMTRYPHEFSGGQRQRIAIARALISNPEFIVLDEPTSALDVSVQAQILNLFKEIQKSRRLSYLFISHNLSVIRHISHSVAVMYLGNLMEYCPREELFASPLHPYTQALLRSIPKPFITDEDISDKIIKGDVPSPLNPPEGCRFNTRCPLSDEECQNVRPVWREIRPGHWIACHKAQM